MSDSSSILSVESKDNDDDLKPNYFLDLKCIHQNHDDHPWWSRKFCGIIES